MRPRPALPLLIAAVATLLAPAGAHARGRPSKAPTHRDRPSQIGVDLAAQVRAARLGRVRTFTVSGSQQYLPTSWCGNRRTTDDVADAAQLGDEPVYKVVYAYASDQPDRFDSWKNQLQANVSLIGQFMSLQDGATKSPRFDMGTSCGPRYVDIQTVALPSARSYYADSFPRIKSAVAAALGSTPAKRNVVILADGLTTETGGFYGLGEHYTGSAGEVAGPANIHNDGGLYAALFAPLGYDPPTAAGQQFYPGFWPEGMLHEMTHTLGAVSSSAPHATTAGHCTDGSDVMCYDDGGTQPTPYSTSACPVIAGSSGMTQTYDCGRDDYFSTNPAPGSYLATHWNVYDNVFESSCATIGFACGADSAAPPAGLSAPRVTGARSVPNTLTADNGTWSGTPTSFARQWQRDAGGGFADIAGASAATYTLVPADASTQIRVKVTATNANGSASSTSAAVAIAALGPTSDDGASAPAAPVAPVAAGPVASLDPPAPPAAQPPAGVRRTSKVRLRRGRRTALKVTVTSRSSATGIVATVVRKRVKVARRGTYRLTLCAGPICITKRFRARHGKAKLPKVVAASRVMGRVRLRLIGPGGTFAANVPA